MDNEASSASMERLLARIAGRLGPEVLDPFDTDFSSLLGEIGEHYGASRVALWYGEHSRPAPEIEPDVQWQGAAGAGDDHGAEVVELRVDDRQVGIMVTERASGAPWSPAEASELSIMGVLLAQLLRRLDAFTWLRSAYFVSPIGMAACADGGRIVSSNEAFAAFLGRAVDDVIGTSVDDHLVPLGSADRRSPFQPADRRFVRGDGSECWGRLTRTRLRSSRDREMTFIQVEDVTDQRDARIQLEFEAQHDHLTGLVNRRMLLAAVEHELLAARGTCGLLLVDVDRFKTINDALGHPEGDRLLGAVAERLRKAVRTEDVVCRLGGDEFAVLLRASVSLAEATAAADRLLALVGEPVALDGQPVATSVSIGISISRPSVSLDSLLREADAALYRAKAGGRNRWVVFDDEMRVTLEARSRMEGELRLAVTAKQLELHYQPEISLLDGQVTGVEALVRWPHDSLGTLGAHAFVVLAEEVGLIDELGRWVIGEACRALARWTHLPDVQMAVNVSAVQLGRHQLVDDIAAAIDAAGIDPSRLVLEITETAIMADVSQSMSVLEALSGLGVGLAIDDFGTGFSSLSHLKRLPVDTVKIDRSFVDDLVDDDGRAIVVTILGLARSLGLDVVAEGVTTTEQLEMLASLDCGRAQGHLFAPALPEAEVLAWIADRSRGKR